MAYTWKYKHGENEIEVLNGLRTKNFRGSGLYVNGQLKHNYPGIGFRSEYRCELDSGEKVKAIIKSGFLELTCSLYVDGKLLPQIEE